MWAWCLVALVLQGPAVLAQVITTQTPSPAKPDQDPLVTGWLAVSRRHADAYDIRSANAPNVPFRCLPEAVFRHSQPTRGDDIGAVYLWVDSNQRPQAIGTVFAYTVVDKTRAVCHEFHSLSGDSLVVKWEDRPSAWQPSGPGTQWHPIDQSPDVSKSPTARKRQAKELADSFAGSTLDYSNRSWELRLIPKPIYQYEVPSSEQIAAGKPLEESGSLFVLCQGTDPEIILWIVARPSGSALRWEFTAASFTDYASSLKRAGSEVWSTPLQSMGEALPHWIATLSREQLSE